MICVYIPQYKRHKTYLRNNKINDCKISNSLLDAYCCVYFGLQDSKSRSTAKIASQRVRIPEVKRNNRILTNNEGIFQFHSQHRIPIMGPHAYIATMPIRSTVSTGDLSRRPLVTLMLLVS